MKKIVFTVFLGAAFFLSTQSMQAQEDARRSAQVKVEKLDAALDLDEKQTEIIHRAYVSYEINMNELPENHMSQRRGKADRQKYESSLMQVMKSTLTAEQYSKYLEIREKSLSASEMEMIREK